MVTFPALPFAQYRAVFLPHSSPRFSDFPGSAWRGALGHSLKRTVCVTRGAQCTECLLYRSCLYPYFFDTPPPADAAKMRRYLTAPHPFVLRPTADGGMDEYRLGFVLFGQANRHLPVFIHALQQAIEQGKGVAGNRMRLLRVEQELSPGLDRWQPIFESGGELKALAPVTGQIPDAPSEFTLQTESPLRIKREGRLVGPGDFRFSDLFCNLLRRISMLMQFHTSTPLEMDFRALTQAARSISAETQLHWRDLSRYSARQKTSMQMGGIVGEISVHDQPIGAFWPFLWIGQWAHAGSGATMGLGRYRLASLPQP